VRLFARPSFPREEDSSPREQTMGRSSKDRDGGRGGRAAGPPSVTIFPFLAEQGSGGERSRFPDPRVRQVPKIFEDLFPNASVKASIPLTGRELSFQGSCLSSFLKHSWDALQTVNIIVTHRNFLANEVLKRGGVSSPGSIPNAAVVGMTVKAMSSGEEKNIIFVRHCTSHHNASRTGSGSMTTCADVTALSALSSRLKRAFEDGNVLYGSSILPRAVLSCIALQAAVSDEDLEAARNAFDPDSRARPEEVDAYKKKHACSLFPEKGSYCAGAQGTFNLS